ncbi:MAG: S41 family peptidase [Vulcanimicrobiota bacterium]
MKNHKKISSLVTFILAFCLMITGLAFAGQFQFEATGSVISGVDVQQAYSKEDIRKKLRKKYEMDYKPFLAGEKQISFDVNKGLYRQIYYYVTLKHVEPVENEEMLKGVFAEVTRLLNQAKIDTSKLNSIPKTGNPIDALVKAYGDQIDPNLLGYAAVRGMLDSLNDPHSVFMLPSEYKQLRESMSGGNFSGIGVYIMLDPDNYNWLTVSEPIEGTPAYNAGLKPGDVIIEINGESTKGEPIDVAVAKIRGPVGTTVKLTVKREGEPKPLVVPIKRAFIHVNSVKKAMIGKDIGYIKLRVYGTDSADETEEALNVLENKGAKAIILDLRNNSGGLIDASEEVCSKFLPMGATVVTSVNRAGHKKVYKARGGAHKNLPLVVLINELSASASEITAGALRDHERAILIGERSFGKGSVQELWPIDAGADMGDPPALKLTIALFYTPKGIKINKKGLEPDIKVLMEPKNANVNEYKNDIQLQKAVKYLKNKI